MKMPQSPPSRKELIDEAVKHDRLHAVFSASASDDIVDGYLHWDKLRHRQPPAGLNHREWWLALKARRSHQQYATPLLDTAERRFVFTLPDPIPELLQGIDQQLAGTIAVDEPIANPHTKNRYLISSLVNEAITSSQLEGAATTRKVAKEMIRRGRQPRDRDEQMIMNNFLTMQRIGKLRDEPLGTDRILELHRIVTTDTLDDPTAAGRVRNPSEIRVVGDILGETTFHTPPPADQLASRMEKMCRFANGEEPKKFIHPVIRAIILHFWLAYDHPFVDGNGRTARALFYWSMLKEGYWLAEFISISGIIRKSSAQYGRAFLYTQTDDNDLTYFVLYHLEVINKAIQQLRAFFRRKTEQIAEVERTLHATLKLNHRQRALITHALRTPGHPYTIASHQLSHQVTYQTARTDLLNLSDRGLLQKAKIGREWVFTPIEQLNDALSQLT